MAKLDDVLHQPTRLRIVAFLVRTRVAAVVTIRDALGLTDGNLAGHLRKLEASGYVQTRRVLRALRFEVQASITPRGSDAVVSYAAALRQMLEAIEPADPSSPPPS